jgi:hypothetical protein
VCGFYDQVHKIGGQSSAPGIGVSHVYTGGSKWALGVTYVHPVPRVLRSMGSEQTRVAYNSIGTSARDPRGLIRLGMGLDTSGLERRPTGYDLVDAFFVDQGSWRVGWLTQGEAGGWGWWPEYALGLVKKGMTRVC